MRSQVRMAQKVGQKLGFSEVLLRKVPGMKPQRILYIAHDNLNQSRGVLKTANPATDIIVLVESARMTTGRPWHKERLFFLLSAARHFAEELSGAGFTVRYLQDSTTVAGLKSVRQEFGDLEIWAAEPSSHRQFSQLRDFGVQFEANDFFLTGRSDFQLWAERQKSFVMENIKVLSSHFC